MQRWDDIRRVTDETRGADGVRAPAPARRYLRKPLPSGRRKPWSPRIEWSSATCRSVSADTLT